MEPDPEYLREKYPEYDDPEINTTLALEEEGALVFPAGRSGDDRQKNRAAKLGFGRDLTCAKI